VNRLLQAGRQHEGSHEQEPAAHGRHEVADIHAIAPLDDLMTSYTNARPGAGLLVVDLDLGTASGLLASRCRTSPM
jgi:hypothetical protein